MNSYDDYGPHIVDACIVKQAKWRILFELGYTIRELRKQNGETLEELANALDITKSTLSKYENGLLEIPSSILPIIAGRYKVSVSELYDEDLRAKNSYQVEAYKEMIKNITSNIDNTIFDECYYVNIFCNYFNRYLSTTEPESFDIYYAVCLFLEQITNMYVNGHKEKNFNIKKDKILDEFIERLDKVHDNNYKINSSIFIHELSNDLSDNKFRTMKDFL